jgi:pyruvate dehydrogenase E1 component alpha subunit
MTPPTPEQQLAFFRGMLRLRMIEDAIVENYPREEMRCPVHLSVGQEAASVGAMAALRRTDQVVSTHRGHGHYIAKGGKLDAMLAEMFGKATGCSGGRGGSMNLTDLAAGVLLTVPIVGGSIPIGVGAALAARQRGEDHVVMVCLGDAAVEEGVFHEAANFAALRRLPVVFLCENNLYSVYTALHDRQPDRPITRLAEAHGMATAAADGNDVEASYAAVAEAAAAARAGDGPRFVLLDTYRYLEHCGPNADNHLGYRTEAEFNAWHARDPVPAYRAKLRAAGLLSAAQEREMTAAIETEIGAAFDFARRSPFPDAETAGDFAYAQ